MNTEGLVAGSSIACADSIGLQSVFLMSRRERRRAGEEKEVGMGLVRSFRAIQKPETGFTACDCVVVVQHEAGVICLILLCAIPICRFFRHGEPCSGEGKIRY